MSLPAAFGIAHHGDTRDLRRVFRQVRYCLVAALFLLPVIPGTCPAADPSAFNLSKLSVDGELLEVLTEDLNADGLRDIMILHRKGLEPEETRWISIFWYKQNGGFSTAASQSWEIDSAATVLDVGNVSGNEGKEICFLTPDAVRYYSLASGAYKTVPSILFQVSGMTVSAPERSIPYVDFVRDWNGDGGDEIGIFKFEGISIFSRDSTSTFTRENRIAIHLQTTTGRISPPTEEGLTSGLRASYTFPDIRLVDYDADGDKDMMVTDDDHLVMYRMQPDGTFSATPDEDVRFDVRTQREKIEASSDLSTVIADLSNDSRADAIVTKQTSKGLSSFRGVVNIYYGKEGGYSKKPDQLIVSEGTASSRTFIRDVNGDGKQDMILPSVSISIPAIIRFLITKSLPITFNIFLLNQDNKFPDKPDFAKEVKLKIDLSGQSDTQSMDFEGDYNGDKRRDFVFATGEDELSIYLGIAGDKKELFSNKPVAKVPADAFGELISPDLNADGYSDMVIYYPESKERKGLVEVLINQRKIK